MISGDPILDLVLLIGAVAVVLAAPMAWRGWKMWAKIRQSRR